MLKRKKHGEKQKFVKILLQKKRTENLLSHSAANMIGRFADNSVKICIQKISSVKKQDKEKHKIWLSIYDTVIVTTLEVKTKKY